MSSKSCQWNLGKKLWGWSIVRRWNCKGKSFEIVRVSSLISFFLLPGYHIVNRFLCTLSTLIVLPCVGSERNGAKQLHNGTSEIMSQNPGILLEVCFQNFHHTKGMNTNMRRVWTNAFCLFLHWYCCTGRGEVQVYRQSYISQYCKISRFQFWCYCLPTGWTLLNISKFPVLLLFTYN